MNLSAAQMKALWEQKKDEELIRGSKRFQQCVKECVEAIEEIIEETDCDDTFVFVDVIRSIAEEAGIALKKKKGKRKGKSTGVSRANGNRKVNAYILLLTEERHLRFAEECF